jgi:hypothetical protein
LSAGREGGGVHKTGLPRFRTNRGFRFAD